MNRLFLTLALAFSLQPSALVATPFYYDGRNADGTPNTNEITMLAWPPSTNTWTVVGTNIIFGGVSITLTPDTNGYATNWAYPNTYLCIASNLNTGFYVSIEDTTNLLSLATYVINAPVMTGTYLDGYGLVTNWLSFAPATNSNAGIDAALGFEPATNSNAGIQAALGYEPATNTFSAATNLLGYLPATNTFSAATNLLGYLPATNTFSAATNLLGYLPATNTSAALIATLAFQPATNLATVFSTNLQVIVAGDVTNTLYFTNGILGAVSNP